MLENINKFNGADSGLSVLLRLFQHSSAFWNYEMDNNGSVEGHIRLSGELNNLSMYFSN